MAAQYRLYRSEDDASEGLETTSWSDPEPGIIQIYEKTTETLPFRGPSKRVFAVGAILTSILILIIGFSFGYYYKSTRMAYHNGPGDHKTYDALHAFDKDEDSTIIEKIRELLDRNRILRTIEKFSTIDRTPGSAGDESFSYHIYDYFRQNGLDVSAFKNFSFKAFTKPVNNHTTIELLDSNNVTLTTAPEDSYEYEDLRPFLPLAQVKSQEIVTNQIVYANRGTPDDYNKLSELSKSGLNVSDKIIVLRFGGNHTSDIIQHAQERGATAVLLFPDPDIYGKTSPFPEVVRLPNDAAKTLVTTFNAYPDYFNSISPADASIFGLESELKISVPVIPISFNHAAYILRGLTGPDAPTEWNCFEFTLRIGSGYRASPNDDGRERLRIRYNNAQTNLMGHNVVGVLKGSVEPDRYVIIGSRRDSLNRGVLDSLSSTATMLEIARVFGELTMHHNWRPRRSIVFVSFGAESYNMIGSNDWVYHHRQVLKSRAVAYLNFDQIVLGNLTISVAASPLLHQTVFNSTKQTNYPYKDSYSLYHSWINHSSMAKSNDIGSALDKALPDDEVDMTTEKIDTIDAQSADKIGTPGNVVSSFKHSALLPTRPQFRRLEFQSLYSSFFITCGVPVVDIRFTGFQNMKLEPQKHEQFDKFLPILNSKYDNVARMRQIDPDMSYHLAMAQVQSDMIRDLADSIYIPFNLLDYAVILREVFNNLSNRFKEILVAVSLDLNHLDYAIKNFTAAAHHFHRQQDKVDPHDMITIRRVNDQLMDVERVFLDNPTLSASDGNHQIEGFPGLMDFVTQLESLSLTSLSEESLSTLINYIKVHHKLIVNTINAATSIIADVDLL